MFANANKFVVVKTTGFELSLEESILVNFNRLRSIVVEMDWEIQKLQEFHQECFGNNFDLSNEVQNYEIKLIELALKLTNGNQSKAVKLLGIKKSTLNAKIKRYNILAK